MSSETLIEFPAELSVKAMGLNSDDFVALIEALLRPLIEPEPVKFSALPSKEGKYLSVRVHFTAKSHEQLLSVYAALKTEERVLYTL